MEHKRQAHETASILFKDEGVSNNMYADNAKEITKGEFRRKLREVDCSLKTTEPHTPKANAAEVGVKEMKLDFARELHRTKCPIKLWDHCLELRCHIRSMTAKNVFSLEGEVPETMESLGIPCRRLSLLACR